jgi:hypothetical protein
MVVGEREPIRGLAPDEQDLLQHVHLSMRIGKKCQARIRS